MMNSNKMVSIIVPVYKVEKYLATCVDSILHQSYINWELILVDDGSPDLCPQICDSYAQKDNRIRVIHQANQGQAAARNHGLDVIKGEFVAFLDSDDFWHPDYLQHMMNLIIGNEADIVHCTYIWGYDNKFPKICKKEVIRVVTGKEALYKDICDVLVWGKIFKSHLYDGIRMPVGVHNEDDCTTWKVCYRAKTLVHTSRSLVYHVLNDAGLTAQGTRKLDLEFQKAFEERQEIFSRDNETELVRWNLFKWNKSIMLCYGNSMATQNQRSLLMKIFKENQNQLKELPSVPLSWRVIFGLFRIMPLALSKTILRLKDIIRYHTFRRFSKSENTNE